MSAFQQARTIEKIAIDELLPWLRMRSERVDEVPSGLFLQKVCGDFIVTRAAKQYGVELKAEAKFTGNLYLETWSNRPELTFGWLWTSRADWLFYFFTDNHSLYVINLPALQQWAVEGHIYKYPERPQAKYDQLNYTYGRIVPIADIPTARVPIKRLTAEDRKHNPHTRQ